MLYRSHYIRRLLQSCIAQKKPETGSSKTEIRKGSSELHNSRPIKSTTVKLVVYCNPENQKAKQCRSIKRNRQSLSYCSSHRLPSGINVHARLQNRRQNRLLNKPKLVQLGRAKNSSLQYLAPEAYATPGLRHAVQNTTSRLAWDHRPSKTASRRE